MSLPFEIPGWLTLKAGLIIATVVAVIGFYFYVGYLRSTIQTLRANNATLNSAVKIQKDTIDTLLRDFDQAKGLMQQYFDKYKELEKRAADLEDTLYREKYGKDSLEELILRDEKKRVEKLINEATNKVMRCFEILTGSPLKEGEKIDCSK